MVLLNGELQRLCLQHVTKDAVILLLVGNTVALNVFV